MFFAYLRERCGREMDIAVPDGTTVGELWDMLQQRFPVLQEAPVRLAVNRVYVDKAYPLHDNDELALIPPVSGGTFAARDGGACGPCTW
jgi:molybdopterin converting factor subunit 1